LKAREPRRKVLVGARMRTDGHWADVQILDASSRGFLIQSPRSPARGTYIELCRGQRRYVARVVWQTNQRCGVRTQDALSIDDLLKPPETQRRGVAPDDPAVEWRERHRVFESIKRRAQSSRQVGKIVEFASIAGLGLVAAVLIFGGLGDLFGKPLTRVSEALTSATRTGT